MELDLNIGKIILTPLWKEVHGEAGRKAMNLILSAAYSYVSSVAQSCPTLFNPLDCSLPGSSVHGSFQARILNELSFSSSS